jgi:hypothetical protein
VADVARILEFSKLVLEEVDFTFIVVEEELHDIARVYHPL